MYSPQRRGPGSGRCSRAAAGGRVRRPLVFGQYGEFGDVLETLLDDLAVGGADAAAERYLLESSVAAVGVQKRLLRQRLVCCVAQAQADVLALSRPPALLPAGLAGGGAASAACGEVPVAGGGSGARARVGRAGDGQLGL